MTLAAHTDIRSDKAARAAFPDDGLFKHFVLSRKIDVPALIADGTLTASGLLYNSGSYVYYLFNLPQYCIVKGAWIFVRTVDSGGGAVTIYLDTTAITSTMAVSAKGSIISSGWATGSTPLAANTGPNATPTSGDTIGIYVTTANLTTAIFDVCVEVLKGDQPYNAGTLPNTTGQ